MESKEVELTDPVNRFSVAIDFAARFNGFDPVPLRPARPANQLVIPGTVAYWRFDNGSEGTPMPEATASKTFPAKATTLPG